MGTQYDYLVAQFIFMFRFRLHASTNGRQQHIAAAWHTTATSDAHYACRNSRIPRQYFALSGQFISGVITESLLLGLLKSCRSPL